jgi:hypothetical protein
VSKRPRVELVAEDIATQVGTSSPALGLDSAVGQHSRFMTTWFMTTEPTWHCCLQCQLLTEVVDAELEEELQEGAGPASRLSLTQVSVGVVQPTTCLCETPGRRQQWVWAGWPC